MFFFVFFTTYHEELIEKTTVITLLTLSVAILAMIWFSIVSKIPAFVFGFTVEGVSVSLLWSRVLAAKLNEFLIYVYGACFVR